MNKKLTRSQFLASSIGITFFTSTKLFGNSLDRLLEPYQRAFETNEKIKAAYDLALKTLNPTKAQLERGLELHKGSLVFDSYGFQPMAAIDTDTLTKARDSKASQIELQDLKEEMTMTRYVHDEREQKEYKTAWEASGVTCVFQNAGEEGNEVERLLKRLARYTYATDMMKDFVIKAATPEEVLQAKKAGKHALYFSGNGVPIPQDWVTVEEELRFIRVFFQLGIRMMHLTYNRRNMIGDGCGEPSDAGLSDFGRAVIKEMNRVGVIVDIAHSGWKTSLEAAKLSEKPMVASHSTSASIHEHIRSKPDEIIKAIADTDGYLGVCCIPRFLGGSGDIAAMMKHIDYVAKKFGPDHVAIGTDKAYTSQNETEGTGKVTYSISSRYRTRWEALWPDDPYQEKPYMRQSMLWTNWPLFTVGLVQLGYSDEDIQKIIGGNVMRVAGAALA
ncbi:MAG: membrane dipeptidase [Cyclobacteriaceae bacterium]